MSKKIIFSNFRQITSLIIITTLFKIIDTQYSKDDCFDFPNRVCANNGQQILEPRNKHEKLLGWYTFDEINLHDSSGHNNDAMGEVGVGPSSHLKGYSGYFNGSQTMLINNSEEFLNAYDMSLSLWIYLLEDSTGNWRTIVNKGNTIKQMTPTVMLWPNERRLHVRVSTDLFWNEGIESKGTINMKSWTHICVVISGQMIQLYINGNLDNQLILQAKVKMNKGQWHIGKDPWHPGTRCYIDDFKIYNFALTRKDVETEAYKSNGLTGMRFVKLGCESCSFLEGLESCKEGYHMCSYPELYSGGFVFARKNGWFKFSTEVWARQSKNELLKNKKTNEIGDSSVVKMTLCCID